MATTGERIREVREELGWTLDNLGEKAGLSKGFLSDVETNKRDISSENLLKVANALGASLDYLLRGEVTTTNNRSVEIPAELSQAAEQLNLTYSQTLELLDAHRSVIARRSNRSSRHFTVKDWIKMYELIKKVYG